MTEYSRKFHILFGRRTRPPRPTRSSMPRAPASGGKRWSKKSTKSSRAAERLQKASERAEREEHIRAKNELELYALRSALDASALDIRGSDLAPYDGLMSPYRLNRLVRTLRDALRICDDMIAEKDDEGIHGVDVEHMVETAFCEYARSDEVRDRYVPIGNKTLWSDLFNMGEDDYYDFLPDDAQNCIDILRKELEKWNGWGVVDNPAI